MGSFDPEYAWNHFPKTSELNPPNVYVAIILDVDYPSDSGWPGGKPSIPPSWMVVNTRPRSVTRRAGGIHAVYALEIPVARHKAAHRLPLAYLSHIADRLSYHLGADPGYKGVITRNPINPGPECYTHWGRMFPYTLRELDQKLPKGKLPKHRLTPASGAIVTCSTQWYPKSSGPSGRTPWEAQGWSEAPWLDYVLAAQNPIDGRALRPALTVNVGLSPSRCMVGGTGLLKWLTLKRFRGPISSGPL